MFRVEYSYRGSRRVVPFVIGAEALRFAASIRRELLLRPTAIQIRAPWGAYLPQSI